MVSSDLLVTAEGGLSAVADALGFVHGTYSPASLTRCINMSPRRSGVRSRSQKTQPLLGVTSSSPEAIANEVFWFSRMGCGPAGVGAVIAIFVVRE